MQRLQNRNKIHSCTPEKKEGGGEWGLAVKVGRLEGVGVGWGRTKEGRGGVMSGVTHNKKLSRSNTQGKHTYPNTANLHRIF